MGAPDPGRRYAVEVRDVTSRYESQRQCRCPGHCSHNIKPRGQQQEAKSQSTIQEQEPTSAGWSQERQRHETRLGGTSRSGTACRGEASQRGPDVSLTRSWRQHLGEQRAVPASRKLFSSDRLVPPMLPARARLGEGCGAFTVAGPCSAARTALPSCHVATCSTVPTLSLPHADSRPHGLAGPVSPRFGVNTSLRGCSDVPRGCTIVQLQPAWCEGGERQWGAPGLRGRCRRAPAAPALLTERSPSWLQELHAQTLPRARPAACTSLGIHGLVPGPALPRPRPDAAPRKTQGTAATGCRQRSRTGGSCTQPRSTRGTCSVSHCT